MSAELHQKLLSFLMGEFVRKEGHQCTSVELVYSPGNGYKDEMVRDWVRQDDPDKFEMASIPDLVTLMMDTAEGEADAKPPGRHRFVVRTKQFLGGRQICSFALQPSSTGNEDQLALSAASAGGGNTRQDAQVISQHASQLMRVNAQMFDGTIRVLGATNQNLTRENAELRAENIILRREVEDARSNKLDKEFQIAMAADKNARSNAAFNKFLQLGTAVVAKIGGAGDAGGAGGPNPFALLVSEFGQSLRQEQIQVLLTTLDMGQKIMFKSIMDEAVKLSQPPPDANGNPANPAQ